MEWLLDAAYHVNKTSQRMTADEGHQKLIKGLLDGIQFSRHFVPTYLIIVAVVLLVISLAHWTNHARRKDDKIGLQRISHRHGESSIAKPLNLTSAGEEDWSEANHGSSLSIISEQTPLTSDAKKDGRHSRPSVSRRFKAFLMYQPAPIPALTASENNLPANGVTLLILLFFALNIFYAVLSLPFEWSLRLVWGNRTGLLIVVNLPILFLLGAKN